LASHHDRSIPLGHHWPATDEIEALGSGAFAVRYRLLLRVALEHGNAAPPFPHLKIEAVFQCFGMPNGILIVIEIEHRRGGINVAAGGHPVDSIRGHGTGSSVRAAL
jgi:hypothetical protein